MLKSLFVVRDHEELELLVSSWSIQTYKFVPAWMEFVLTLEVMAVITRLPFGEHNGDRSRREGRG